ncbi:MAG TPA: 7-carboxy-7-deazaguanine synthase [Xanthobacteraceae bacterium]|jgi:7-carboxy-7-deazaguanine synthase (Cx14CxxC type)
MTYTVHSIFKTLQGEGFHAGRSAVFCRFAGCNLWSGREKDRASAVCKFCDTEFVGGAKFPTVAALADAIAEVWGVGAAHRIVVFTGGEPGLQLDRELIDALQLRSFASHVETNGTIELPSVRWITLSPKAGAPLRQLEANELKIAWPQQLDLEALYHRIGAAFSYLQPIDGPELKANTAACIDYVQGHPWWRLSTQTHKFIGVP